MSAVPDSILDRLRKIEALAQSGVAGERENAAEMLRVLCEKYGVTVEQLTAPETTRCWFTIKSKIDDDLLGQCVAMVLKTSRIRFSSRARERGFELTLAQEIDVREAFAHFRKAWQQQLEETFAAFIQLNGIVAPASDDGEEKELTPDERARLRRMGQMMLGMTPRPWKRTRLLESGVES